LGCRGPRTSFRSGSSSRDRHTAARPALVGAEAIDRLLDDGPALGRPLADRIVGSRLHNLKELRPGSSGAREVRILFIFHPARNAVLLVAGDKSGRWQEWYAQAIPAAEATYEAYLKEQR
jgi:hypothetical protein